MNSKNRRGDGGTYLVIADRSDEFNIAIYYACRIATARRGHVAIAHVTDLHDFVHWGKVEAMMRHDLRKEAEQEVFKTAKVINEEHNVIPSIYIRDGHPVDKIVEIIEEEENITALVLGASTGSNPGPLITYFSGKGMSRLRIPVIIVPGHLDKGAVNAIT